MMMMMFALRARVVRSQKDVFRFCNTPREAQGSAAWPLRPAQSQNNLGKRNARCDFRGSGASAAPEKAAQSALAQLSDAHADQMFRVILADPPWKYRNTGCNGAVPYPTMSTAEICSLPVRDLAAPDASVLLLWTTCPMMPDALAVMQAWGFTYKTAFLTWVKTNKSDGAVSGNGIGWWSRSNVEMLLLGTRGSAGVRAKLVRPDAQKPNQVVLAPREHHSRKPAQFRSIINEYFQPGLAKLELFARPPFLDPLWTYWGNEVPGCTALSAVEEKEKPQAVLDLAERPAIERRGTKRRRISQRRLQHQATAPQQHSPMPPSTMRPRSVSPSDTQVTS